MVGVGHDESPEDVHSSVSVELSREALWYVELTCSLAAQFLYLFADVQRAGYMLWREEG